jgi:hypothetical protein
VEASGEMAPGEHKVRCKRALKEYSRTAQLRSDNEEFQRSAVVVISCKKAWVKRLQSHLDLFFKGGNLDANFFEILAILYLS